MKVVPADVRLAAHKEDAAKEQQNEKKCCQKAAQVSKARAEIAVALAKGAMI